LSTSWAAQQPLPWNLHLIQAYMIISELPLLGTSRSLKIDMLTVTVKLLPLPLLPGLNYSKTLIVQNFTAIAPPKVICPLYVQQHSLYRRVSISCKPTCY
jgi:hypothetical protein